MQADENSVAAAQSEVGVFLKLAAAKASKIPAAVALSGWPAQPGDLAVTTGTKGAAGKPAAAAKAGDTKGAKAGAKGVVAGEAVDPDLAGKELLRKLVGILDVGGGGFCGVDEAFATWFSANTAA